MSVFAVIPVKTLLKSKTRLCRILTPTERQTLTLAMLEDVLKAVKGSHSIHETAIVSSDPKIQLIARRYGTAYLAETGRILNQAVEQGLYWCVKEGAKSVLVLPADIPLVTPSDVDQMVSLSCEETCMIIAPSKNGGTNGLLQKPPNSIPPCFGRESFGRHVHEASKRGIVTKIYRSETMSLDLDSPDDLENLLRIESETASHKFLKQIRFDARSDSHCIDQDA